VDEPKGKRGILQKDYLDNGQRWLVIGTESDGGEKGDTDVKLSEA
jgi:hypothetical protein